MKNIMLDILEKGVCIGEEHNAEYVELRAEDITQTVVGYSDARVDTLNSIIQSGVACRVLLNGAWGFTCGTVDNIESLVKEACDLAQAASAHIKEKITLKDITPHKDTIKTQYQNPPSQIPLEDKISRLDNLYTLIKDYDKRIKAVSIKYTDSHGFKHVVTNEGTQITQETGHVFNYCWVTGKENGVLTAARDIVGSTEKGFEYFEEETAQKIANRMSNRVLLQLKGKTPKRGSFPCVLGPGVIGTLAHEALGHLAEADRTLNSSFNGKLGEKVASDIVTMVDSPIEDTFGASKYDDEGVLMQHVDIIKDGMFCGLLTNREYASKTEMPLCGSARAESFLFSPIIRMRNTFFDKGDFTDEELFEDIDFGYYCIDYRGGQANLSSSFQVGVQEAFEIKNGEIGEPIKDLSISGIATDALFLIDGVGKKVGFNEGICGKDNQQARVYTGGPHVKIKQGAILFGGRE